MWRSQEHEDVKINQVCHTNGEVRFVDEEGNLQRFSDLQPVPKGVDGDYIAVRHVTDPETNAIVSQQGIIKGRIAETKKFVWEHKVEELEGAVVVATVLGVAMRSLYKRHHRNHS